MWWVALDVLFRRWTMLMKGCIYAVVMVVMVMMMMMEGMVVRLIVVVNDRAQSMIVCVCVKVDMQCG